MADLWIYLGIFLYGVMHTWFTVIYVVIEIQKNDVGSLRMVHWLWFAVVPIFLGTLLWNLLSGSKGEQE